jgi:hypothetical protein
MENYSITIDGCVVNKKTNRILKPCTMGKYYGVQCGAGNKQYIHHLVANQWLPAPTDENLVIDHIDRNRYNNHASNLRWVSRSINSQNRTIEMKARSNSQTGEHHIKVVLTKRQINPTYVVEIKRCEFLTRKCFNNLEEAKTWRDINVR